MNQLNGEIMGQLQAIENALININPSVFQELADSFLSLKIRNYSSFFRTGSKSGKQKTTIGTPDSYFLLNNGKYVFVEHSTNISEGVKKLRDDLEKCLDPEKTGIKVEDISEIILCFNFNLKTQELDLLKEITAFKNVKLTTFGLDDLSIELKLQHKDLVNEYLNLPFDTGQLVSISRFIKEYNKASNGIATPLDIPFLHRFQELDNLSTALKNKDFVILTGASGVGKTKIALEAAGRFVNENQDYKSYCVSYKHASLMEDLHQYFNNEDDFVLIVDDANRIDALGQILGIYRAKQKGNLKVILTVRDYAYPEISLNCQDFSPVTFTIPKFSDEELLEIIKSPPINILNSEYHKIILAIAEGNPRLAIMASLLAKEEQNIYALSDVSDLFEKYFSTFIRDKTEFSNSNIIRSLGIISFFYTIPFRDKAVTSKILEEFEISWEDFIDSIERLEKMELVDIQYDYVKIPEQNLAVFIFFKAFIQEKQLSFDILLENYFEENNHRFRECVISANNTFGPKRVMETLRPSLSKYWKTIKADDKAAFSFLKTFWYYLKDEALEFCYHIISALPHNPNTKYDLSYGNNDFNYNKNEVIELLGGFLYYSDSVEEPLKLLIEYVRKLPENAAELVHKIKGKLTYDHEDRVQGFKRQEILLNNLIKGLQDKDYLYSVLFFELSKEFLKFKFHHLKGGRNNSFTWYDYPLPLDESVKAIRGNIWNSLNIHFQTNEVLAIEVLKNYKIGVRESVNEVLEFDFPFVIEIMNRNFNKDSFRHVLCMQKILKAFKKQELESEATKILKRDFTNIEYETYLKLNWNFFEGKRAEEYKNRDEYYEVRKRELTENFLISSSTEASELTKRIGTILESLSENEKNTILSSFEIVIEENFKNDFELGLLLFKSVVQRGNAINFIPRRLFHFTDRNLFSKLWSVINRNDYNHSISWKLLFFMSLPAEYIKEEDIQNLCALMENADNDLQLSISHFENFLTAQPTIFQRFLSLIVEKNRDTERPNIILWNGLFTNYFEYIRSDIELVKVGYIQQSLLSNHFDYGGEGFLKILFKDRSFLRQYLEAFVKGNSFYHRNELSLGYVWKVEGIEESISDCFELLAHDDNYYITLEHYVNTLFRNIPPDQVTKAENFIKTYVLTNYLDLAKMKLIVYVVRESMKKMYNEILLLYISLNQNSEQFSELNWRGNGASGVGDVILSDIEAADWRRILELVESSEVGLKLIPIKKYIKDEIEYCQRSSEREKLRRFLNPKN